MHIDYKKKISTVFKYFFKIIILSFFYFHVTACSEKDLSKFDIFNSAEKDTIEYEKKTAEINVIEEQEQFENIELSHNYKNLLKLPTIPLVPNYNKNITKLEMSFLKKFSEDKNLNSQIFEDEIPEDTESKTKLHKRPVAFLIPLTGKFSRLGSELLDSAELALFQTGETNTSLLIRDTKGTPEGAYKAFLEVESKGVELILGPLFSGSTKAVAKIAKDKNIPVLAFTNDPELAQNGIWVLGPDPGTQVSRAVNHVIGLGKLKFGALVPDDDYGDTILNALRNAIHGTDAKLERVEKFSKDGISLEKAAKQISLGFDDLKKEEEEKDEDTAPPLDAIVIASGGTELRILSAQLAYNGVDSKKTQLVGTASWHNNSIFGEPSLVGGIFAAPPMEPSQNFLKFHSKIYGNIPSSSLSTLVFDAVALIASLSNNKIRLRSQLFRKEGFMGVRGLFRLRLDGKVDRGYALYKVGFRDFVMIEPAPKKFSY